MATTMQDLREVLRLTQQAVAAAEKDYAEARSRRGLHAPMPDGARQAVAAAKLSMSRAEAAIAQAVNTVPGILGERHSWPEGRKQRVKETVEKLAETVQSEADAASQLLDLAHQQLLKQAMPTLNKRDEAVAIDTAKMLLGGVAGTERASKLVALAKRGDDVGAVCAEQWGRDFLEASVGDPRIVNDLHNAARAEAVQAAATGPDKDRANAAQYAEMVCHLRGQRDATMHRGRMIGEQLSDLHVSPGDLPSPEGSGNLSSDVARALGDAPS